LALYYSAADLHCFPPVYGAFGLVLIEGMACGCPAVVFDYPAMNELVTEQSGYLAKVSTAAAYAATIRQALSERGAKREAAIEQAQCFDMDAQIDQVVDLYAEVTQVGAVEAER
jgi:glycosyltransferase involved in cell wall biosynthesis